MDLMTARHAKVARLTAILLLGSVWLGSGIGCRKTESQRPDGAESKPAGLVEIPRPDITKYDGAVHRQLQSKRSALMALREVQEVSDAQLSVSYGEMGMLYHVYDLYDAAEACYRNAQALAPGTYRWPYYLGRLYAKQGDSNSAVTSFKQALSIKADDMPALAYLAYTHLAANRPDEAQPLFERVLAKDHTCAYAYFGLGKIAMLRHEHKLAARYFRKALLLQPNATFIHYPLAMAYRNLKLPAKAAEHLAKKGRGVVIFNCPLMHEIGALRVGLKRHLEAGAAALRAGRITEALAHLHEAVRADPDNAMPRLSLAATLAKTGDSNGAIRQFREVIRLRPKNARAYYWLAVLAAKKGDNDEAISHFRQAVTCDPQEIDAHLGLAELAIRTGNNTLAVTHYALAVEIDPRHVSARLGHVVALTKAGKHAEATDSIAKSRKILPGSMPLADAAARLWATCPDDRLRDGAKALKLAQALFRAYRCIEYGETVAMAFAETGNYDQAKKWQTNTIDVATRANRRDAIPRLKKNLALYESGKPCRTPW